MYTEINNLINSLSESNFRSFIKEFNKYRYKTNDVRIVDGPYDGGNDLEVYLNDRELKRNIQITVQKTNYDSKLIKDLAKAKENAAKYSYLKNLDFYISQNVSKESRNDLEKVAEFDYDIILRIYDSNYLAQEIESQQELIHFLYSLHGVEIEQNDHFDKSTKIVFDVLTHNKNTIEIKKNFINSYVYAYLFSNPDSSVDEVYNYINPLVNNSLDKVYFEKEINYLRLKQYVLGDKTTKRLFLSDEKRDEISKLYQEVNNQEVALIVSLNQYIDGQNIETDIDELLQYLYKIYQENYSIDIEEIKETSNSYSASLKKSLSDLQSYFIGKGIDEDRAEQISKDLIELCSKNDFLSKLSTVHLFSNLFNSNKLEKYLNSKEQVILIDTQILIRLLCVLYPINYEFKDSALNSVKILYDTLDRFKDTVHLKTTYDYVEEVVNHLTDALKLIKFLNLTFVQKLGTSKNVFYNAYLEFKKYGVIDGDMSFLEFVSDLVNSDLEEQSFDNIDVVKNIIQPKVVEIFEYIGFELIYHSSYPNFQKTKRDYEIDLASSSKFRSPKAVQNDLRTILYLSTKDYHVDESGNFEEPYLITWDSAFYSIRKKLMGSFNKEYSFWYIYSPLKLVDRLSVMNFTLNPQSINLNIIALTENNFNYSSKHASFIDVISSFFNKNDISELDIIKKLANLNSETKKENTDSDNAAEFLENEEESSLLKLLLKIRNHYGSSSEYQFGDIVNVFQEKSFEDKILDIISETLTKKDYEKMYSEFEILIKERSSNSDEKEILPSGA